MLYHYKCELVRILDGDTVELDIDLGMRIWMRVICRLYGINTPEMKTPDGPVSKDQLSKFKIVQCRTYLDRRDKYGRLLVELFDDFGVNMNAWMFDNRYAVKYPKKAVFTPNLVLA